MFLPAIPYADADLVALVLRLAVSVIVERLPKRVLWLVLMMEAMPATVAASFHLRDELVDVGDYHSVSFNAL